MKLRQTTLALALLSTFLLTPIGASATPSDPDGDPFTGIAAVGSSPGGAEFSGTLDIQHFDSLAGHLIAIGTLSGQVTGLSASGNEPPTTLDQIPVEVPVGAMVAGCDRLSITFGPLPVDIDTTVVQVAPIRIGGPDQSGAGSLSADQLCALADQLRNAPSSSWQAGILDAMRQEFD